MHFLTAVAPSHQLVCLSLQGNLRFSLATLLKSRNDDLMENEVDIQKVGRREKSLSL